jgi:hypothetical protein
MMAMSASTVTANDEMILPGFDVHQNFDSVLMSGGRHGKGNGTESAIHG